MRSPRDRSEQGHRELDKLIQPGLAAHGYYSYSKLLWEDESVSAELRSRFDEGSSRGEYPALSERLREISAEERDLFFRGHFGVVTDHSRYLPEKLSLRLLRLGKLLFRDVEFETRHHAAYKILFASPHPDSRADITGMPLPSFKARIHRVGFHAEVMPQLNSDFRVGYAWSTAYPPWSEMGLPHANQRLRSLDPDYLRGILLAILSRHEERMFPFRYDPVLLKDVEVLDYLDARLTDLRLAVSLEPGVLRQGLIPLLRLMSTPITIDNVAIWRHKLLGSEPIDWEFLAEDAEPEESSADQPTTTLPQPYPMEYRVDLFRKHFGEEERGSIAVSFAAAALMLFLDLDMPGIGGAKPYRLAEQIESLAQIIRGLAQSVNRAADSLDSLLANRAAGRQSRSDGVCHAALRYYRQGCDLRELSAWLGIRPYDSRTATGSRGWKRKVLEIIARGKDVEAEHFPAMAAIFANADNAHVRKMALYAYRVYVKELKESYPRHAWLEAGRQLRINTQKLRGVETLDAYLELGHCLAKDLPLP